MSESNHEKVERFIEFNQRMIETAMTEQNLSDQSIHAKALLCCIFDSLAKSRFPSGMSNGERFKKTVSGYTSWDDCERVSLLHLLRAIEVAETVPPEFDPLNKWAENLFSIEFPLSNSVGAVESPISNDPDFHKASCYWPTGKRGNLKPIGDISLYQLQHLNLLWLYRNSLVHEYRIPGMGQEWQSESTLERNPHLNNPYYQEVSVMDPEDKKVKITNRWELIYPTDFFLQITKSALTNIAEFHKQNKSSPFAAYPEGSYWIPPFNEE